MQQQWLPNSCNIRSRNCLCSEEICSHCLTALYQRRPKYILNLTQNFKINILRTAAEIAAHVTKGFIMVSWLLVDERGPSKITFYKWRSRHSPMTCEKRVGSIGLGNTSLPSLRRESTQIPEPQLLSEGRREARISRNRGEALKHGWCSG